MALKKTFQLAFIFALIFISTYQINGPVSNCLGNCKACKNNSPLQCLPLLDATTKKQYPCVSYYNGPSCSKTASNYFNLYNQSGIFFNWSLPTPPPSQTCNLIFNNNTVTNDSFTSIGPFSFSLNATKTLSFSQAQNIKKLIIKVTVAIADSTLYSQSSVSNDTSAQTIDEQGNIVIIQTVSTTTNKNTSLSTSIPFLSLSIVDKVNSGSSSFSTSYQTVSPTNTSCGFVYQYQFVADSIPTDSFRQPLLTFYLPNKSLTTWYLLAFSAEGGCSGYSALSQGSCSTCLSGFYPTFDADGALMSCTVCDYRCNTCSSATQCVLCEAYTISSKPGSCQYPPSYKIYNKFNTITGSTVNLKSTFFNTLISSQSQSLNLGLTLETNQSYLIKFYHLYSQNYAQKLNQLNITVNGKPYTSYSALQTFTSTLMQQVNNGQTQLFYNMVKIDLIGKPCLKNFSIGIKGSSQANQQFYIANLVLIQYSCGQNCLDCTFNPALTAGGATCTKCKPFFNLAQNCKICANGFFLRDNSVCVKCYSNCKQCIDEGSRSCTDCLDSFKLQEVSYNSTCTNCLFNLVVGATSNCNSVCPFNYTLPQLRYNSNCNTCLNSGNSQSSTCNACWIFLGLASGKCQPTAESAYTFYSNDLPIGKGKSDLWQGSQSLQPYNCTSDYVNLLGIPQSSNHTSKKPTNLVYSLKGLPEHRGVLIVFNLFKIGDWLSNSSVAETNVTQIITVTATSPGYQGSSFKIQLNNSYGGNICGEDGNQMIWAVQANLQDHSGDQINLNISAPDQGLFVRQVEVYLGNCNNCGAVGLSYGLSFIPMYSDNNTQTGLDTWVNFNHPVYFTPQANQTQQQSTKAFIDSFQFSIDGTPIPNAVLLDNKLSQFNYIKYFLPLNQSYVNATLTAVSTKGDLVYTQDGSVSRQLTSSVQTTRVERYDNASLDTRRSISQLSTFFHFFTWFCLIVMIVCVMIGVGVVFQQFSIMLQLIYYHIYITSIILPPSIKIPLSNAVRMQHLNYFSSIPSIQNSLFGNLTYPGDKIFQQYNVDVYFLRSFYPIMIINAIYIGWFIINFILYRFVPICQNSDNKIIRFMRSIAQRPLAYFDQVWRYQYLATMWACIIQFTRFDSNSGHPINLVICVLAFAVSIIWPFVVTIYTYRRHFVMNVNHFRYLYHDLYYLKISSVADQPKYYLYVCIRFGKYFMYAIFIGLFVNQNIIGPVILLLLNIIEASMAYFIKIYRSPFYLFTRIIENILLVVAAILCLVIFGFSNSESLGQEQFQNLGYGLAVVFVLMVINAIARFFYLSYKKIYQWKIGTYDVGEVGEKQNYDEKSPIKIPQSQRFG